MTSADTIAAIASAPGRGAVGVIRMSGPAVPEIARSIVGALPAPRHATLATFLDAQGAALDQGLALYFAAPASYTGEHVLELHGHGGALILDLLLKRALELGCRMARPGEFSERAFLNGKMDMAQAEAVADLIDAGTAAAARAAVRSLQGEFSAAVHELQSRLTALRTYVEAAIDFPDEEIDFLSAPELQKRLRSAFESFESLGSSARQGTLLRDGLNVVLAGKPNAGKSSLMNRLAGDDVAIVAEQPGTTRDVLRQQLHLDGLPLHLIDTAGLRAAADGVEAEGIRRARQEIARADHVLYVVDAALGVDPALDFAEIPTGSMLTIVFNKIDVTGAPAAIETTQPARVFVSALTGQGLDLLRAHLQQAAGYVKSESGAFAARRRHLDALQRARQHTESAARVLGGSRAFELFAEELRLAQRALGEITGEFTSEHLLGEIFSSFCIGK